MSSLLSNRADSKEYAERARISRVIGAIFSRYAHISAEFLASLSLSAQWSHYRRTVRRTEKRERSAYINALISLSIARSLSISFIRRFHRVFFESLVSFCPAPSE